MDRVSFINNVQNYYNQTYAPGTLTYITEYLDKYSDDMGLLFVKTIKSFSGQYKSLPDIAIFEGIINDIKKDNDNDLKVDNDYDPTGRLARERLARENK